MDKAGEEALRGSPAFMLDYLEQVAEENMEREMIWKMELGTSKTVKR